MPDNYKTATRHPRFGKAARENAAWRKLITAVENSRRGGFFFTRGAVESFDSCPSSTPLTAPSGRVYFATSEDFGNGREWKIRSYDPSDGTIRDHRDGIPTREAAEGALGDAWREDGTTHGRQN